MNDKSSIAHQQALDQVLPISARQAMQRVLDYSQSLVENSGIHARLLSVLRISDPTKMTEAIEKDENLVGPIKFMAAMNGQTWLSPYGKSKYQSLAELLSCVGGSYTSGEAFRDRQLAKKVDSEASELSESLTPQALELICTLEWQPWLGFYLYTLILGVRRLEDQLTSNNDVPYTQIAQALDGPLSTVIQSYTVAQMLEPGSALLNALVKARDRRAAGGKNSKKSKEAIFVGFNEWAIALPSNHTFAFTAHAAKYYLHTMLKEKDPDLYKKHSSGTIRTMGERLKEYCKSNGIAHPING